MFAGFLSAMPVTATVIRGRVFLPGIPASDVACCPSPLSDPAKSKFPGFWFELYSPPFYDSFPARLLTSHEVIPQ